MTQTHQVRFHITRARKSKLGDYRWPQVGHPYEEISVNGNLNPYFLLWVLLHEMAHLCTHSIHGNHCAPHGHEWQQQYALLIREYINLNAFPDDVVPLLEKYISRIPLHRPTLHEIENLLRHYDKDYKGEEELQLSQLPIGTQFSIKNNRNKIFVSLNKRRTRYECIDVATKQHYLIAGNAPVVIES